MKDNRKTRNQLIDELVVLRRRIERLEKSGSKHERTERSLKDAWDGLTRQVEDRTHELLAMNRQLKWEIKKRGAVERELRASEETYKSVIDHIGIGVSLISPRMEILTLNNQMKEWFPQINTSKKPLCYKAFNNPPRRGICSYCPTLKTLQDGEAHE